MGTRNWMHSLVTFTVILLLLLNEETTASLRAKFMDRTPADQEIEDGWDILSPIKKGEHRSGAASAPEVEGAASPPEPASGAAAGGGGGNAELLALLEKLMAGTPAAADPAVPTPEYG